MPRIPIPYYECTVKGKFAITFDDGPFTYTAALLDLLKSKGVKATFFLNGDNYGSIEEYRAVVLRMFNEGHQIASHTWTHADITDLTETQLKSEITQLETALRSITGSAPTFFRPPYGNTNTASLKVLMNLGYTVVKWDVSNEDTVGAVKTLKQQQATFNSTLAAAGIQPANDGHISLSHDTQPITAQKFAPWVFDRVRELGYTPVTVGECLGVASANWYKK
jgi:peptidoglycan/xylan/chitin deacetylase (PgdA/CDA1 family)